MGKPPAHQPGARSWGGLHGWTSRMARLDRKIPRPESAGLARDFARLWHCHSLKLGVGQNVHADVVALSVSRDHVGGYAHATGRASSRVTRLPHHLELKSAE